MVYVRQSSMGQVMHNQESQRRQCGLAERASELGFRDVMVIDEDLGKSGSGIVERPGFQRLVGEVCSDEVGAVFCIEASRLARNGRDWHHLIELCGMTGVVVIDPDGIYDPAIICLAKSRREAKRLCLAVTNTLTGVQDYTGLLPMDLAEK